MTTIMSDQVEFAVETRQLLSLGRQEKWSFQVLGKAPLPEKPVRMGEWLITPAEIDTSVIPARALTRIQAIFAAGIRPQGFVLVHEAPKLLAAPASEKPQELALPFPKNPRPHKPGKTADVETVISSIASGLEAFMLAILPILAMLLVGVAFAAANGLDPILVAVTEDGYWIEIDRWINE